MSVSYCQGFYIVVVFGLSRYNIAIYLFMLTPADGQVQAQFVTIFKVTVIIDPTSHTLIINNIIIILKNALCPELG